MLKDDGSFKNKKFRTFKALVQDDYKQDSKTYDDIYKKEFYSKLDINNDQCIWDLKYLLTDNLKHCKVCGKAFWGEGVYCSRKCFKADSETVQSKIKATMLRRYGVENAQQSKEIQERTKKTNLQRYGVENPHQNHDVIERARQTNLQKYGVDNPFKSQEIKDKIKKTNLQKYGVENPTLNESIKEKIKEANRRKFGCNSYKQIHLKHLEDLNRGYWLQNFIDTKVGIHYKEIQEYYGLSIPGIQVYIKKFNLGNYILHNRSTSQAENELFTWIPTTDKVQSDRTLIPPLELDIVLPSHKLAIEYNGLYWHSNLFKDEMYHLNKTLRCKELGYQLLQIFETEDLDIWKSIINEKLGFNTKIPARKCEVQEISNLDARVFCQQNHLQGATNAKVNLGLYYNSELVEVMTFSKPRFTSKYQYELLRLCTKKFHSVTGGASKLFKYFLRTYNPKSVVSYANLRYSTGKVYEILGFKLLGRSNPGYFYTDCTNLFSRLKFQKHKLKDLKSYDESLTECQIMEREGFLKIWDCGNLVYIYI